MAGARGTNRRCRRPHGPASTRGTNRQRPVSRCRRRMGPQARGTTGGGLSRAAGGPHGPPGTPRHDAARRGPAESGRQVGVSRPTGKSHRAASRRSRGHRGPTRRAAQPIADRTVAAPAAAGDGGAADDPAVRGRTRQPDLSAPVRRGRVRAAPAPPGPVAPAPTRALVDPETGFSITSRWSRSPRRPTRVDPAMWGAGGQVAEITLSHAE